MYIENIKKICVVGGGLMGRQIALNNAIHGYECYLTDNMKHVVEDAEKWKEEYLAGRVKKGRLTAEEAEQIKNRFHIENDLKTAATGADLIIEAIVEKEDVKKAFYEELNGYVRSDALIASNASYISSSAFAECIDNPSRLANLHYFNPVLIMKLTEVVKGPHTSQATVDALLEFSKSTGKIPALLLKESEGFIVNYILKKMNMASLELVEKGIASYEDVDIAVENGLNHPMGPFRLMDLTGIDLSYFQFCAFRDRGEICPGLELIKEKYEAGEFGRKTGKGWYAYQNNAASKGETGEKE